MVRTVEGVSSKRGVRGCVPAVVVGIATATCTQTFEERVHAPVACLCSTVLHIGDLSLALVIPAPQEDEATHAKKVVGAVGCQ